MNKLPEPFRSNWIAALRGGEYKQGRSWLYNNRGDGTKEYCCLGVAACVLGVPIDYMNGATLSGLRHSNITDDIREVLYKEREGHTDTYQNHFIAMNDSYNNNFLEIADYIEQNL